jgi:hypothetical protein
VHRTDRAPLVCADGVDPRPLAESVRDWRPHLLRHRLVDEPLLRGNVVERLVEQVPAKAVVHHVGRLPLLLPRGDAAALALDPVEVARGIGDNSCWMSVRLLETLPDWEALLAECLAAVRPVLTPRAQVFLASPGAITPAHFDGYHNLLLQVRGTKELSIGTFTDPRAARREIARHFDREHENLRELPTEVTVFRLEPGQGVYIPPYAFHWARAVDEVSLAMSCNFADDASRQAGLVELCNARLRRLGLDPAPPRSWPARDRAKVGLLRSWRKVRGAQHRWRRRRSDARSR